MKKILSTALVIFLAVGFIGCGDKEPEKQNEITQIDETAGSSGEKGQFGIARTKWEKSVTPEDRMKLAVQIKSVDVPLAGSEKATIETNKGTIMVELYSKDAPNTVRNFVRLSESGFYDGLIWHRFAPGFVIQGGDPTGTGMGNAGYNLEFEPNPRKHLKGALGMARGQDLNSGSCQFYICLNNKENLDGSYVIFGIVTEGMDVVEQLRAKDTIRTILISK